MSLWLPRPSENVQTARKLGMSPDDTATHKQFAQLLAEPPLPMIGGAMPWPPIEKCYGTDAKYKNETTDKVKAYAMTKLAEALNALRRAHLEQVKTSRDNRFSHTGRLQAMQAVYKGFMSEWGLSTGPMALMNGFFGLLNLDFITKCVAAPLASGDAAGAVLDSEYRGIIRAMSGEAARFSYLLRMVDHEPASPILLAVVRAAPDACGLDRARHDVIRMRYAVNANADILAAIWGAACALDALRWVVLYGAERLAKACGLDSDVTLKYVQGVAYQPERTKMAETLEAMIRAAETA